MQAATANSYGQAVARGIEARVAELLADLASTHDGWAYEIEDIRERDERVDDLARQGDFDALRRSKNGRELLALWQARTAWQARNRQPQDEYDGFAPLPELEVELIRRTRMHDEEIRWLDRAECDEESFFTWEAEDAFITIKTAAARAELIEELRSRGVNPKDRAVRLWVERRMNAKSHNRLRAYKSCTYALRHGFFTGFAYDGWKPDRE